MEGDRIPSVLLRQAHVTDPHDQTISHKTYDLIRSFWGVRFQHMNGTIDFSHAILSLTGEYLISDNVHLQNFSLTKLPLGRCFMLSMVS